jgi:hypothetical protein
LPLLTMAASISAMHRSNSELEKPLLFRTRTKKGPAQSRAPNAF